MNVTIALLSETILYGIILPLLSSMLTRQYGVAPEDLQRYSSILLATYAGSSIVVAPIAGVIGDRLKSKKIFFLLGLLLMAVVSLKKYGLMFPEACSQYSGHNTFFPESFTHCPHCLKVCARGWGGHRVDNRVWNLFRLH